MYIALSDVNVRENPGLGSKMVATLAKGSEVDLGDNPVTQDGFIWRKLAGQTRWVAERNEEGSRVFLRRTDIELSVSSATLFKTLMEKTNVRDQPSLNAAIVGDIGRGQEIHTEGEPVIADGLVWRKLQGDNLWIAERAEDGSQVILKPVETQVPPQTQETKPMVFVTVMDNVNVRNQPSLSGQIIGRLALGQGVQVIGDAAIREGFIWRRLWGDDELWVAERKSDDSMILLRPAQSSTPETDMDKEEEDRPTRMVALPPNVDIDPNDYERTFRASLAITRAFEGGNFDTYQNYDAGIVSYGIMQFTLAAGSLGRVLDIYLNASGSPTAQALRTEYQDRVRARDANLRNDTRFRDLLKAAAQEPAMQTAQYSVATTNYWDVVIQNYIQRRGNIRLPLTYALLFDMGINFGVNHGFVRKAEEQLGVPPNSRPGDNGITEQQLTAKVAELRRESHYNQAARDNLPGLRVRGDFWVNIVQAGDWYLQGDAGGFVYPKSGSKVQVRNPF
jgi:hypothetical protein